MTKNKIRVALADNQNIFRKGMESLLKEGENISVVLETSNEKDLLNRTEKIQIDVLILDARILVMGGIETTLILKRLYPELKILVIIPDNEKSSIINLLENGANGFILRDAKIEEVFDGINTVRKNGYYLNTVTTSLFNNDSSIVSQAEKPALSKRELEIIKLLSLEMKNSEIAEKLFINIRTVQRHRENIRAKINVTNVSGILMYAVKNNLLD
ncbi:MAG TPA: response regulator transcription factor [Bacteroidia bacterium]|jgi:DNA-binding NarL/FixJ family response regulator